MVLVGLDAGPEGKTTMFGVVNFDAGKKSMGDHGVRDAITGREGVQPEHHALDQFHDENTRKAAEREGMECGADAILHRAVIVFDLWDIFIASCGIQLDAETKKVRADAFKLMITMAFGDGEPPGCIQVVGSPQPGKDLSSTPALQMGNSPKFDVMGGGEKERNRVHVDNVRSQGDMAIPRENGGRNAGNTGINRVQRVLRGLPLQSTKVGPIDVFGRFDILPSDRRTQHQVLVNNIE